jgi:hypothetical protein
MKWRFLQEFAAISAVDRAKCAKNRVTRAPISGLGQPPSSDGVEGAALDLVIPF